VAKMRNIGFDFSNIDSLVDIFISQYKEIYPNLETKSKTIKQEIINEVQKFEKTLETGLREFNKIIDTEHKGNHIQKLEFGMCEADSCALNEISGKDAFKLFSTYPILIIQLSQASTP